LMGCLKARVPAIGQWIYFLSLLNIGIISQTKNPTNLELLNDFDKRVFL